MTAKALRGASRKRRAAPVKPVEPLDPVEAVNSRWAIWLPALILIVAGAVTYSNSLNGPLIWDDQTSITNNETIRELWPLSAPLSPPPESPVSGRPIANLSFAINYALDGANVTGYHVWNLGVHVMGALLLFGIISRQSTVDSRLSTVAALLWLVHPIQSEAVDYLTERTESMMGLFFLLTLYAAIRARRSAHARRWNLVAILACMLGMGTKESMVTAPLIVLLYDRVFEFPSMREAVRARWPLYAGLAASWIVLAGLSLVTVRSTVGVTASVSRWTYLLNQAELVPTYLWLTLWPHALVLDYGLPRMLTAADVVGPGLIVLIALAVTALALVRWPAAGFLGAAFFITLAPTSSVVPIVSEVGAERRMYVPLAALAVLAAVGGRWLLDRLAARFPERAHAIRRGAVALTILALACLAGRTMYRNSEYSTPLSLWGTVIERRPQGRARMSYASELITAGRHDEAMKQLRLAVQDFPDARFALATELAGQEHLDEAAREMESFVHDQPERPNRILGRLLLGHIRLSQGRVDDAVREFQTAIDRDASNTVARQGLVQAAAVYLDRAAKDIEMGHPDQAEGTARTVLRIDARNVEAHNLLGVALASQGRIDDAIAEFRTAVQLDPAHQRARNNLTHALSLVRPNPRP